MKRLLLLILLIAPGLRAQPPWISAEWARIKTRMGPIDFDGRLSLSWPIHHIEADGVAWDVSLDHTVDVDACDLPSSRWTVRALTSYLVPEGRGSLRALLPNGRILHFARVEDQSEPIRDKGKNWLLWKKNQGYRIKSPLGNLYFFTRGQLVKIVTCHGRELAVAAEAGHIRSIVSSDASARPIVSCDYDSIWEPVTVIFDGSDIHKFKWDHGLLLEWDAGIRGRTRFEYRNRMVVRVTAPKQPAVHIEWDKVPNWTRWSDIWWSPIRVTRVNEFAIAYDLGHEGDKFTTTDTLTGLSTVTKFNWFSRVVTQQVADGEPVIVRYNTAVVRPGYFLSIRLLGGKNLEDYDYGPDKRLIRTRKISADGTKVEVAERDRILEGWDGEEQAGLPIYEN